MRKIELPNFKNKLFRNAIICVLVWLFLAAFDYYLNNYKGVFTGTGILFPFSVLYPSSFLWSGFFFGFLFLFLGLFSFYKIEKLNTWQIIIVAIVLVLLGNMAQGNIDEAFLKPFYFKGRQYYTDAINITDWQEFLSQFNILQKSETLQLHTTTHPPFTTLLHYFFLQIFSNSILGLSLSFFAISSLSFIVFKKILVQLNFAENKIKKMVLLFSVVPSVNIYMLVSIDGIVLFLTLLFLYSFISITKNGMNYKNFCIALLSLVLVNMLSFSGLYLFAFIGIYSLLQAYKKKYTVFSMVLFLIFGFFIFFLGLYKILNYNHLKTFFIASSSENPGGFILLHEPIIYFATRLEDISEILFFLSISFLSAFFTFRFWKNETYISAIFLSGILALISMFITGAYGTGETARACLYIVPFFLILLKNVDYKTFNFIYIFCLLQTFFMQVIGNYYW